MFVVSLKTKIMKTKILLFVSLATIVLIISSCGVVNKSMKNPNNIVEFERGDFEFSEQLVGEGTQTRIFGVDWTHLLGSRNGAEEKPNIFNLPVIGVVPLKTSQSFALYDLMDKNPGYDVIFYPQYETKINGIPFIYQKSHTKVTARLAKIK